MQNNKPTHERLSQFLTECESLGLVRLIVTNGGAVLEAQTTLQKLFYADLPKGHYANMHGDPFEFHLNMDMIAQIKFELGTAKRGNFNTYAIRLLSKEPDTNVLSIFLQWTKPGEYAPGQIEAWEALKLKYGESWSIDTHG